MLHVYVSRLSLAVCLGFVALLCVPSTAWAQVAPPLGVAQQFGVLGNSAATGAAVMGATVIGDVGSSPTATITNFPPSSVAPPFILHTTNDAVVQQAHTDAIAAYTALLNQGAGTVLADDLSTVGVLTAGIYSFTTGTPNLPASTTLTLNGAGIFVFNVGSTLTAGALSTVAGTANPCNIYWRVGTSAVLAGTNFRGTVIADASITVGDGTNLTGRVLAGTGATGAVTLAGTGGNTIGGCSSVLLPPWALGDFDGDGKADVLWRNVLSGANTGWLMNGLTVSSAAVLPMIADTNWQIVGVGDGKADVLWRNKATGQDIGWLMNGLTVVTSAFLPTIADTNWQIVGVGDLNGDGKADVILRNTATGQDIGWLMNGLTVASAAFLPTIADTNWAIVGVGDLNGDGRADVLWRNKVTGQDIGWLMNGLTVSNSAFLPTIADTNWRIVGAGDLNGDGKADVLLRNMSTGQNIAWLMNGLTVTSSAFLPTIADTNWEVKGVGDMDGDGKADVLWRNKSTGQDIGWLMNGLTVVSSAFLPTIADTNWR